MILGQYRTARRTMFWSRRHWYLEGERVWTLPVLWYHRVLGQCRTSLRARSLPPSVGHPLGQYRRRHRELTRHTPG
eukprot:3322582-Rhodomonas_salina.2